MENNYLNIQILLIYLEIKIYLIIYIDLRESNVSHFEYIFKKIMETLIIIILKKLQIIHSVRL